MVNTADRLSFPVSQFLCGIGDLVRSTYPVLLRADGFANVRFTLLTAVTLNDLRGPRETNL